VQTPDRAAHNVRLRPLIEQALQSLPAEQREVFLLREYQGLGRQAWLGLRTELGGAGAR
jgi:DNA-directed RNA polymerase specialized sigma24 family protein